MQDEYGDVYPGEAPPQSGLRRLISLYMKWGGAVVSVALMALFVLWAYRLGVRDAAEIPVIQALDGPIRVQPDDPGGQVAENQGLEVNEILAGEEAQRPRETQLAPATLSLDPEDTPAEDPVTTEATGPVEEGVDTAALVPETPEDDQGSEENIEDLVASAIESEVDETPAPLGSLRPRTRPANLAAATPEAPAAAQPVSVVNTVEPGTLLIQLGAFDSNEVAETQWSVVLAAHNDLLSNRQKFIQRAESNGRVFYRLRVLGFNDRTDQRALCDALGARGVDCIPVTAR